MDTSKTSKTWSVEDIINHSSNWNLAADAALLQHLESFSEEIIEGATETHKNVDKLLDDLNSAHLSLELVKNQFSSLQNVQFIESRVYEEDETAGDEERQTNTEETKDMSEEDQKQKLKEALLKGIEAVNKYYDPVEVPDSDSEDETDFCGFVLRPKDPYIDRPLPFIIGSDDWHKKWHVGLLDSSSESEADKISEKFSDSDSEDDLPITDRSQTRGDYDSLDKDLSTKILSNNNPVANSTFADSIREHDLFDNSDNEEFNSEPAQTSLINNSFARELAAKLGKVADKNVLVEEPQVNTRPIQTESQGRTFGIFSDEPPPIEDDDDFEEDEGLFSSSGKLFDDLDDDKIKNDFWNNNKEPTNEASKFFQSDIFVKKNESTKKSPRGLFDDEDNENDENDLFNEKPNLFNKSFLQPNPKAFVPYIQDEPPDFEPPKSKKPVGGVKLPGSDNLFDKDSVKNLIKNRRQESSESSASEEITQSSSKTIKSLNFDSQENKNPTSFTQTTENITSTKPKPISLFDDDEEDSFEDDLFSNTKKFSSNLFNDFDKDNLFAVKPIHSETNSNSTTDVLEKIVDTKMKTDETKNISKGGLFDEDDSEDLFFSDKKNPKFGDKSDVANVSDDLFKIEKKLNDDKLDLFNKSKPPVNVSLFDEPPPDNDFWDRRSNEEDDLFGEVDNTVFDDINESVSQRVSLFDNEPPALFSESSGIVHDAAVTRIEPDDSFNPFASSSRRLSSDIYNEQQSNDSFFVTKNKSNAESHHISKVLRIKEDIKEFEDNSYLDITPSGDVDKLYSDRTTKTSQSIERNVEDFKKNVQENLVTDVNLDANSLFHGLKEDSNDIFATSYEEKNIIRIQKETKAPLNKPVIAKKPSSNTSSNESETLIKADNIIGHDKQKGIFSSKSENESKDVSTKNAIPGKLKHNININVNALLPGMAPPKKKDEEKVSVSEYVDNHIEEVQNNTSESSNRNIPIQKNIDDFKNNNSDSLNTPEILTNITKNRAKIPVKRRPSTRKARQESIRKSVTDFKLLSEIADISKIETNATEDNISEVQKLEDQVVTREEKYHSVLSSDSKDVNDLFETNLQSSNEQTSYLKSTEDAKFEENKIKITEDSDLFVSANEKAFESFLTQNDNVHDDDDDDLFGGKSDLFAPTNTTLAKITGSKEVQEKAKESEGTKEPPFQSVTSNDKLLITQPNFKNMFDDRSDDLFSTKSEIGQKEKDHHGSLFDDPLDVDFALFSKDATKVSETDKTKAVDKSTNKHQSPPVSKSSAYASKSSLFDDSKDFDDMFSSKKLPLKSKSVKRSLFDDDEGDDLFGSSVSASQAVARKNVSRVVEKKSSKNNAVKKLENSSVFDDPLSSFDDK